MSPPESDPNISDGRPAYVLATGNVSEPEERDASIPTSAAEASRAFPGL